MEKVCSKCNESYSIDLYCKDKGSPDGLGYVCKNCRNIYARKWYGKHKERQISSSKRYYKNNEEARRAYSRHYRSENIDAVKINMLKYYHKRIKYDATFKLRFNISNLIRISLHKKKHNKKSKTVEILGISIQDFKLYLESKFEPWMNWDNHGKYNGMPNYGWDIDHIIPISSANTEEDILKLNHYTNFQPLCSYVNRYIKRNKINF